MTIPAAVDLLDLPIDSTPIGLAAAMYARAGFAPVPVYGVILQACACGNRDCAAVGKHPVGTNWQKRASTDLDASRDLFQGHGGNIGIVIGADHVVIDIDYYAGGEEGLASLPPMPRTLTSRSGSGQGEHRIFALGPGQDAGEITNRKIAPGIDIKTRTGQIVVAPSLHRSGNRYQWIDTSHPAELPPALYEQVRKKRIVPIRTELPTSDNAIRRRADAYLAKMPPAISGSGGHAATFAAARACWGWITKGLSQSDGWALFADYNRRCDPPWNERELRHKWEEAQRADRIPIFEDRPARPSDPPPSAEPDWRSRLLFQHQKSGPDKIARHHENAVVILRYHPAWRLPNGRPRVSLDTHAQRILVSSPPWHESNQPQSSSETAEWTDADSVRLSSWIRREVLALDLSTNDCDRAVQVVAESNTCYPFREYLDSLQWDSIERLPHWLEDYLGAARSDYTAMVGQWWLISAAARTYQPGCKADHVLILEGPQGIRKSSALRTLAGDRFFSDTPIDIGSKDAYLALQGRVIVELGELESLKRSDADRAKVFFSSPIDQYRPPYARRIISVPRGCVFAGTVNPGRGQRSIASYLTDHTGGRRYWPVVCGTIDLAALAAARDQLWAEAAARFKRGERWWPEGEPERTTTVEQQDLRETADPWEEPIANYVALHDEATIAEVLQNACKLQVGDFDRWAEMRASRILVDLGYERRRVREGNLRRWRYFKTSEKPPP